jgi:hypothetical protein
VPSRPKVPSLGGTNERTTDRVAVGECTRCRDFSVQATTTLERINALSVYICRCSSACVAEWRRRPPVRPSVSSRVRAPSGGRHTRRSCRPAGRPSVRRSIVAVDRLARRSASLRSARYRRSCRRPCDRPTTDFRGMSARNFDGICSVPVISPRNFGTKVLGTTRRMSLFDLCFRRKNPPINGRAAIFFRIFSHLFRRGFCLERTFTEGFRAFAAC